MSAPDKPDPENGPPRPQGESPFGFTGRPAFSGRPDVPFWNVGGPVIDVPSSATDSPQDRRVAEQGVSDTPPPPPPPPPPPVPPHPVPHHTPGSGSGLVTRRPGTALNLDDPDFSFDVQEIMAKPPHWLMRCGTSIIASVICVILFLTWLIHYPDSIPGTMTISGVNPAVEMVARQSGHLEKLLVKEGDLVEKGRILGVIESSTSAEQVFALKEQLATLIPFLTDPSKFSILEVETETQLGRLQSPYSQFLSDYIAFQDLLADNYSERTINLLVKQAEHQHQRVANMTGQVESANRGLDLAKEKFARMEKLQARGSLSTAELEDQERAFLAAEGEMAGILRELNAEKVSALDLEKQVSDLRHNREESLRNAVTKLQESLKRLYSEIEIWEEQYVLRAPVSGRVGFYDFWANTQYVTAGSQVFVVAPESASLVGRMEVKGNGVGKITAGQPVHLRFADYDYKEFGMVTGKVRSVSLIARQGAHLVIVDLGYPLKTNFDKEIPFKQAMQAEASIITEDLRLIERIFYELRRAFTAALESDTQKAAGKTTAPAP